MGFEPICSRGAGTDVWYRPGQSRRQMVQVLRVDHAGTAARNIPFLTHEQFDKILEIIEHYGTKNILDLVQEAGIPRKKWDDYRDKFEDANDRVQAARRSFKSNLGGASIDDIRALMQEDIPVSDRININKFLLERVHDDFKPKQELEISGDQTLTIEIVDQSKKGEIIDVQADPIRDDQIEDGGTEGSGVHGLPVRGLQIVDRSHDGGTTGSPEDGPGTDRPLLEMSSAKSPKAASKRKESIFVTGEEDRTETPELGELPF